MVFLISQTVSGKSGVECKRFPKPELFSGGYIIGQFDDYSRYGRFFRSSPKSEFGKIEELIRLCDMITRYVQYRKTDVHS